MSFKQGERLTTGPGVIRGYPPGDDAVPVCTALGFEYTGPDGQTWVAVHWDDEEDPDFQKFGCLVKADPKQP